jgi:hypothetical protein
LVSAAVFVTSASAAAAAASASAASAAATSAGKRSLANARDNESSGTGTRSHALACKSEAPTRAAKCVPVRVNNGRPANRASTATAGKRMVVKIYERQEEKMERSNTTGRKRLNGKDKEQYSLRNNDGKFDQ